MSILVNVSERYVEASHSKHLVRITDLPTKFSLTKFGNNIVSVIEKIGINVFTILDCIIQMVQIIFHANLGKKYEIIIFTQTNGAFDPWISQPRLLTECLSSARTQLAKNAKLGAF